MRNPCVIHCRGTRRDLVDPRLIGGSLFTLDIGNPAAPRIDPRLSGCLANSHRLFQLGQCSRRATADAEITGEPADRVIFVKRVGSKLDDLGVGVQLVQ